MLESDQRKATRLVRSVKGLNCEERLAKFNWTSVEERVVRGELILINKVPSVNWFVPQNSYSPVLVDILISEKIS